MKKSIILLLLSSIGLTNVLGQKNDQIIVTSDIDNFWIAYDKIIAITDSVQQVKLIKSLYIDKGTPGLKAFIEVKEFTPERWVGLIRKYPKFWNSIRKNTYQVKSLVKKMEPELIKFRKLYPELKPAKIYFTIGALRSSGTTKDDMVLIGAELSTGDPKTDISEFSGGLKSFLTRYYNSKPFENMMILNIHEYVHTQEKNHGSNLLSQSIYEGTCDFVTELITGKKIPLPYMTYGPEHEDQLKIKFKSEMSDPSWDNWLYNNAADKNTVPDLGYFIGYSICKSYYERASDKKQAIKDMISLDYQNNAAVEEFLAKSGYFLSE